MIQPHIRTAGLGAFALAGLNVAATLLLCFLGGLLGLALGRWLVGS